MKSDTWDSEDPNDKIKNGLSQKCIVDFSVFRTIDSLMPFVVLQDKVVVASHEASSQSSNTTSGTIEIFFFFAIIDKLCEYPLPDRVSYVCKLAAYKGTVIQT